MEFLRYDSKKKTVQRHIETKGKSGRDNTEMSLDSYERKESMNYEACDYQTR